MSMYLFDETDEYFRNPIGALEAPGTLTLRIKLQRGETVNASIQMYPDGGEAIEADMDFAGAIGAYDVYECTLEIAKPGLYWYCFIIDSGYDSSFTVPNNIGGAFQITAHAPDKNPPNWIHGGVFYHIFVDRFRRGEHSEKSGEAYWLRPGAIHRPDWGGCPFYLPDERGIVRNTDFFGGDLYGIIEKLPYLEELGVTCIYLSPIFEATSNHKYDTGDLMKIDPAFGGNEALELLCSDAGKHGIRVMLDGVFNHVGSDSRYFNRYGRYDDLGAYQSPQSQYYDWFTFHEDGTYDAWWGIKILPAINKQRETYRDFICGPDGVVSHWTKKGVSGWRLDVADELPDEFLDPLCEAIKRDNNDSLIVGEVWEDASNKISYNVRRRYLQGGQLDSVTNYPLKDAMIACVKDGNVLQLADTMASFCKNYPENVLNSLMNIVGTHDTMRILTVLSSADFPDSKIAMSNFHLTEAQIEKAKKKLRLISTLQFTLPGVPCLYYGDEAGMEGGADPFNRRCYPWGNEDIELIEWYKELSRLRKEHNCFKDGRYKLIEARSGVFAFTRGTGQECVLVAINVSDGDRALSIKEFNFDLLNSKHTDIPIVKSGEPAIFITRKRGEQPGDLT